LATATSTAGLSDELNQLCDSVVATRAEDDGICTLRSEFDAVEAAIVQDAMLAKLEDAINRVEGIRTLQSELDAIKAAMAKNMVAKLEDDINRVEDMRTLQSELDAIKAVMAQDTMLATLGDTINQVDGMRSRLDAIEAAIAQGASSVLSSQAAAAALNHKSSKRGFLHM
jgi:hypothetical protein